MQPLALDCRPLFAGGLSMHIGPGLYRLPMCILLWALLVSPSNAQPDSGGQPPQSNPEPAPATTVEEIGNGTYHVYDESGNLRVAFKGITFEELNRRLTELDNLKSAPPSFLIQKLSITGKVVQDFAELTCQIEIKNLEESETEFVRIPLKMSGALLPTGEILQYEGMGDLVLQAEENNQGLSGWLRGGAGQLHKLTVKVLVPVKQLGDDQHLRLHFPHANRSQFRLAIPGKNIVADVRSGGVQLAEEQSDETTIVPVDHLTGDFHLAWQKAGSQSTRTSRSLEVTGIQRVTIEGGQVRMHVNLEVESQGTPFRDFRVTLPVNTRLVLDEAIDRSYKLVPVTSDAPKNSGPQKIDIVLDESTVGPISVQLETVMPFQLQRARVVDLTGIIVNEAVRHSGHIGVLMGVGGDYKVRWVESSYRDRFDIKRVDNLPDPWQSERLEGAFQYFSQSYKLKAEISPPTTRTVVDPEYLISISEDQAELTARLIYQIRGGSIDSIQLDLKQWNLDPDSVAPLEIVDLPETIDAGRVRLPFTRPIKGQLEVTFRARRAISADLKSFSFALPTPSVDSVRDTKVVVLPDDNISLTPQITPSQSPPTTSFTLPERQQDPYYFEYARGGTIPENFELEFRNNPLVISADVESRIQITLNTIRVHQILKYEIRHQSIPAINLVVPKLLVERDDLISLDSAPIQLAESTVDKGESVGNDSVLMSVPLENAIGPLQLVVQFEVPLNNLSTDAQLTQFVPLLMPREQHLQQSYVHLVTIDKLQVDVMDTAFRPYTPTNTIEPAEEGVRYYQSEQATPQLATLIGHPLKHEVASIDVRRAWIQTWLSSHSRDDLAVLKLHSRTDYFEIRLPEGVDPKKTWIQLDGRPQVPLVVDDALGITISNDNSEHILVLRYFRDGQATEWENARIDMPRMMTGNPINNVYWQLVLPQAKHLLETPSTCIPAFEWQWQRLGWHRVSRLDDSQLMSWIGHFDSSVARLTTDLNQSTHSHVYLMRFQSLPAEVFCVTFSKTWLVLISMGSVLLVGLLLIYIPVVRKSGVLFALALCLFAAGFLYPEPTRIIAQVGLLGAGLISVSLALRLAATWKKPRDIQASPGSSINYLNTEAFQAQSIMAVPSGSTLTKPIGRSSSIATPES